MSSCPAKRRLGLFPKGLTVAARFEPPAEYPAVAGFASAPGLRDKARVESGLPADGALDIAHDAHVYIRAGRTVQQKRSLMTKIAAAQDDAAGLPATGIWIFITKPP